MWIMIVLLSGLTAPYEFTSKERCETARTQMIMVLKQELDYRSGPASAIICVEK